MSIHALPRGCLRAASLCLLLNSCTQGGGTTPIPIGETLATLIGQSDVEITATARKLPYASVELSMYGNKALVILAYQGNAKGKTTLWQAKDEATLMLQDGFPFATAGFDQDLMGIRYDSEPLLSRHIDVYWQDTRGESHHSEGTLTTHCESPALLALPLITKSLERCIQKVDWYAAGSSTNTFWRAPDSGRVWAGDMQPWPEAPTISWKVARPWWSN